MKKLLLFIFMAVMLAGSAFAATVITAPADSATITYGAAYSYTATTGITNASNYLNCTYYQRQRGTTSWTTIGQATAGSNSTDLTSTVPEVFGTHQFNVTCTNGTVTESDATTMSVSINRYSSSETVEVVTDSLMGIGVILLSFASLVGLILLWVWAKKKV